MVRPSKSLIGALIDGRYEILEEIATGGVGVVYRARRVTLERTVAVKVMHDHLLKDTGFVKRFQIEAVALSRLDHPHCVKVLDVGLHEGKPYLALEYVPGHTVTQLMGNGRFEPRRAIHVTLQVLETLEHFHRQHIVHRDLKAENVMLMDSGGDPDFVKVLDFGMAKIMEGRGSDSNLSNLGLVPGTPSAMAPEQIKQLPPDPRIDIYATGIMLYEMVVGHRPFRGPDHEAVVVMQLKQPPKPPSEVLGPGVISRPLEAVILKALEKDRFDRFATAGDMAAALHGVPEAPPAQAPTFDVKSAPAVTADSVGSLLVPRKRARWQWIAGGAALFVLLVIIGLRPWRSSAPSGGGLEKVAAETPSAEREPEQEPSPSPAPKPVAAPDSPKNEPWRVHRDLALTYAGKGQQRQAFVEVLSALRDDPNAAAVDPKLLEIAVAWILLPEGKDYAAKMAEAFRVNPALLEALVKAATSQDPAARQNALIALGAIDELGRVDLVEVHMLDFEQATECSPVRHAYRQLVKDAKAGNKRASEYLAAVKQRGSSDPQVKCLRPTRRTATKPPPNRWRRR